MARTSPKILLFYTFALLIPLVLVAIAELGLRQTTHYISDNLFEKLPESDKAVINTDYYKRYFTSFSPSVSISPFESTKDPKTFRILALGGSSMAGYPYSHHFSAPALVELNLKKSYPDIRFEVINFAVTAFNSFGIADISSKMELLEPDAVVIYSGHNEFYGSLGSASTEGLSESATIRRLYLNMYSSALFQFGRTLLRSKQSSSPLDDSRATTMSRMIGNASVSYEDDLFNDTMSQFEHNFKTIQKNANRLGVPLVISTVVSNLKDQAPLGIDQQASDAYKAGKSFFESGKLDSAIVWFSKARDLDPLRFRAPSQINHLIRTLAQYENTYLVDIEQVYRTICESGIEDYSCFTDHLHPNYKGYQFISEQFTAILESIVSSNMGHLPIKSKKSDYPALDEIEKSLSKINIEILTSAPPFDKNRLHQGRGFQEILSTLQQSDDAISTTVLSILSNQVHPSNAYRQFADSDSNNTIKDASFYYSWSEWNPLDESIIQEGLANLIDERSIHPSAEPLLLKAANEFDKISYYNVLGAYYLQQKEYESAKSFLHIVEKRTPEDPNMLFNLAVLHYEIGNIDKALEYQSKYQRIVLHTDTMSSVNSKK